MSYKQTFICTRHDLRFEVPSDWSERGLPAYECYLCMSQKLVAAQQAEKEALRQRDVLLEAMTIKTNVRATAAQQLTKPERKKRQ